MGLQPCEWEKADRIAIGPYGVDFPMPVKASAPRRAYNARQPS